MPRKTARIETARGSFKRLMRSTAGPSATDRKIAMHTSPTTDRTRYSTYSSTTRATSVKNTRTMVRVLICACPATVCGSV